MKTQRIETPRDERVESGPIVFDHCGPRGQGYDWPGVFLRGDLCTALHISLQKVTDHYRTTAPGSDFVKGLEISYLEQLMGYLQEAMPNP